MWFSLVNEVVAGTTGERSLVPVVGLGEPLWLTEFDFPREGRSQRIIAIRLVKGEIIVVNWPSAFRSTVVC